MTRRSLTPRSRQFAHRSQIVRRSLVIPAAVIAASVCLLLAAVAEAEEGAPTPIGSETASVVEATELATSALGAAGLAGTGLDSAHISPADLVDVDRDDTQASRWANMPLVLNGRGTRNSYRRIVIRDVAFKVYVAELYVPEPTADSEQIIFEYPTIELRFTFHRGVSATELRNSALGSFRKLLPNKQQYRAHAENREKFLAYMSSNGLRKGDRVTLRFSDDAVEISVNGQRQGSIASHDFQQLARRLWLDKAMTDRGLRELRLSLLDHRAIARQLPTTSTISAAGP